ncbi:glycosyltransferase family 4 protein [Engelhardtia mirabilis]|uniref:Mannosylfructose-phosphate synthase n=1 Tax=Engelhardtia mirabilis TaxID=2528011 RepID=A0A518BND5_9BACT|nr:Mannosylfructose-phosphate synthase [Planctomycetes bacterium Pla133]QDV02778.1 Mannosylfructose-phosphate synthase [Planctomycetes bacterium Pla86]
MQIALEVTSACRPQPTGVSRYVTQLTKALVAVAPENDYRLLSRLSRWKDRHLRLSMPGTRHSWVQEGLLPLDRQADVIHGLDARVPRWSQPARVCSLHDVFVMHVPGISPKRFTTKLRRRYSELAETCDRLIASSSSTKERFLEHFDFDPDRVSVVHLGVDERFHTEPTLEGLVRLGSLGIQEPYLLYVGELTLRKNLPRILEAYSLSELRATHRLVLAGSPSYGSDETFERVHELGIIDRVVLPGFVPDDDLPQLYAHADTLIFATLYEGFGLPALESLATGTPVVVGQHGALPEVTGGHAEVVDPYEVGSIRAGIERACGWSAEKRLAGRKHARELTWERCAEQTLEVYSQAIAERE